MRRTQIYIDEDLDRALRDLARAEGRSAAAVIREAAHEYLARRAPDRRDEQDPILAMAGAFSMPSDAAAEHDTYLYARAGRGSH